MEEAAVHLVQRLLSLRENKGFGSEEAPRRGSPTSDSGGAELRRFGRGASPPASPYSFVRKHHVPRSGWADAGTDVVLHSPQSLVPSFPLHQVFGPFRNSSLSDLDGIGKGSADEFAIRLHFLPLLFCIDRKSSGAIAPLLFLHNPIKFYYFTFPLLFGAV